MDLLDNDEDPDEMGPIEYLTFSQVVGLINPIMRTLQVRFLFYFIFFC